MRTSLSCITVFLVSFFISSCNTTRPVAAAKDATINGSVDTAGKIALPQFNKVMVVFFENQSFVSTMAQPTFKAFAARGLLLTNFYAETHPSQGNYISLISGGLQGVKGDQNININALHLGDLLEAKGKTWKNYAEGYPGNCFSGATAGRYVRKHVPFISFINVQQDARRCANIVPASQFATDIANGTLPDFSFYSPDLDNDGHDTGLAYADGALKRIFGPLIDNADFMDGMLLIVTFDEDDHTQGNKIYTALIGGGFEPGTQDNTRYNHYSLLRTIEDGFGLGSLHLNDETATPIGGN